MNDDASVELNQQVHEIDASFHFIELQFRIGVFIFGTNRRIYRSSIHCCRPIYKCVPKSRILSIW